MCGIFGVINLKGITDIACFKDSLQFIKHRGPDFDDVQQLDSHTIFGHTRLSIIDLLPSNNQPFSIDDRYTITYNGEVFNYLELKKELESAGMHFVTKGDTEVVLRAFIYWGEDCVNKFNGMWAFAIYDKQLKKLFCSRDRFGIKPFNYSFNEEEFIFSSEIKPIISYNPNLKMPNYNMIANFCYKSLGAQAEQTWFMDILRLMPAHNLTFENGHLKIYRYWDYPKETDESISFEKAKQEFDRLFTDSVRLRMRSDVEVGSTLSSGLDSTSIVGIIKQLGFKDINTFTAFSKSEDFTKNDKIAFSDDVDLDESKIVNNLNAYFETRSNLIIVSFSNCLEKLKEIVYYLESGHSSPATIAIHQVYKKSKEKVKVLMEGQGADELLAGYVSSIATFHFIELLRRGKIFKCLKELTKFGRIYSIKFLVLMFLRSIDLKILNNLKNRVLGIDIFNKNQFTFTYIKDNVTVNNGFNDRINKILCEQHQSGLVNLLHYGDALSMSQGIECRLPFMDYRLVELAFKLPYHYKFKDLKGKYVQRKALNNYIPNEISNSSIKIGFSMPLDIIINNTPEIQNILCNYNYNDFFNNKNIVKILQLNKTKGKNFSSILFRILCAKLWFKIFLEEEKFSLN